MPEHGVSRAALLEIRRERAVIEEGHRFLDEKRIMLAQELLKRLSHYRSLMAHWNKTELESQDALRHAIARHGLEGLQVYPVKPGSFDMPILAGQPFLGITLLTGSSGLEAAAGQQSTDLIACNPSPEAELCGQHYSLLMQQVMQLAIAGTNLMRLRDEYKRTELRVQALENVILPEIYAEEAGIVERLDEIDQEEVIRAHLFSKRLGHGHEAT